MGDGKGARCAGAVNTAMGSASVESLQRAVGRETSSSPLILFIHSTTAQLASFIGARPCPGCWVSRDGEGMISDHLGGQGFKHVFILVASDRKTIHTM